MITTCLQLAQRILWWITVTDALLRVCLDLAAAGKCPPSLCSRCVSGLAGPRIPPVVPYSRLISHLAYSERQMDRNTAMLPARIDPFGLPARLMQRPAGEAQLCTSLVIVIGLAENYDRSPIQANGPIDLFVIPFYVLRPQQIAV